MAFAEAKAPFLRSNFEKSKNQKIKKLKNQNETQGEMENEKLPPEIRRQLSLRNKALYAFCRAALPELFAIAVRKCDSQLRLAPAVRFCIQPLLFPCYASLEFYQINIVMKDLSDEIISFYSRISGLQRRSLFCKRTGRMSGIRRNRRSARSCRDHGFQ